MVQVASQDEELSLRAEAAADAESKMSEMQSNLEQASERENGATSHAHMCTSRSGLGE